jgi:glycosyltransferase involved in cell wall biosynthesis
MSLLSIVTINYNNAEGLKKTIESIINQTFKEFQYVIIDGGSTDDSFAVIDNHKNAIDFWVSEKDKGIYNAMNKGIVAATGDYLLFVNSGDYLKDSKVIENCIHFFEDDADFISGNLEYIDNSGKLFVRKHPEKLSFSYLVSKTLSHPSTFIKRSLFVKYGLYNENLKIVSDWEFFFKTIALNGASFKSINVIITHFDMNGISSLQNELNLQEREIVIKMYLPTVFNNDMDVYIFNKFYETNKRDRILIEIEKNKYLRKFTTAFLYLLKIVSSLVRNNYK